MTLRYLITRIPGSVRWGIFDRTLMGFTSLAGQALTWETAQGAQAWLYCCRVAWRADLVPAPDGWQGTRQTV
jgi:hypothetical protein